MIATDTPQVSETSRPVAICTLSVRDGAKLIYRYWRPVSESKKALLLFHRGHEHSGRFAEFVEVLGLPDFHIFAWDQRGHGQSDGECGYARSVAEVVKDLDEFVGHISTTYDLPIENMVLLGHSVAAVLVSAWVHDYAPPIRAMVLATPALRIKLYVPLAIPGLRLLQKIRRKSFIKSYVKSRMLTHDASEGRSYDADRLISRSIAVNILLDVHDTSTRIMEDAAAITLPTLLLSAGKDWVVKNSAQARFFERLGSACKQMHLHPGDYHAIFHEVDRHRVAAAVREFIGQAFRERAEPTCLLDADKTGHTKEEFDRLSRPLSLACPRGLAFGIQKIGLKMLASVSDGIRLGWETGFNSGQTLDYVYENSPRGFTPLGRLVDRFYLNAIGWRGIRIRKMNLSEAIEQTIRAVSRSAREARILDIAAGPGRCVLDVLQKLRDDPSNPYISAVLRDRSSQDLEAGRQLAAEMGLENATFALGDAFDPASLAQVQPRPNIAIVSGLYELFPDNEPVNRSLSGLSQILTTGDYLIYTNQPWHPQVEMIARVLVFRDGKPWVMRRRAQAEMDQLVRANGFEKIDMKIDPFGIFTVSIARKIADGA